MSSGPPAPLPCPPSHTAREEPPRSPVSKPLSMSVCPVLQGVLGWKTGREVWVLGIVHPL